MHRSIGRVAALLGAGALALAAVSPVAAADDAMVRVLHGSPDTPSVDVYVGAENDLAGAAKVDALSGAEFGDITGYVGVPAGKYAVKVCATADPTVCPIEVPSLTLEAGKMYTVAASDLLASIDANVFVDAPANDADNAQVRVVHLSADTPAVDVLTQDKSAKVVENLAYPNATDYLALPAGSYDLIVCANADNSVCPLDPGALDLAGGTAYSVFAIGSLSGTNGGALTAVVAVDATFEGGEEPAPTAPPTSTIAPMGEGTSNGGNLVSILGILGIAGIATVGLSRRFATRRVEK
jgi:hypothetical protein